MGCVLQRLFSAFPGGLPGVGLLLLRAVIGMIAAAAGGFGLADNGNSTVATWIADALTLASGIALLVGLLTPLASLLVALDVIGTKLSWFRAPSGSMFEATMTTVLIVSVAAAIVLLGPGALSADARFFGRREIIIPLPPSRSTKA
jgi:uncharacterized membrane protein YphA (DoxX/SURF4 family)